MPYSTILICWSRFLGPESSVPVSSRLACPLNWQVTDHWGEPCNRTGELHRVDPFHSLGNLKNHFASIAFCRNSAVYNVRNGAVTELSFVVSIKGFSGHWWVEVDCSVLCYNSRCLLLYWQVRCEVPEVCLSCCLPAVVTRFDYVRWRLSPSFPLVEDPYWWCGDKHYLYPGIVPDIAQKEGSGGPRPIAY